MGDATYFFLPNFKPWVCMMIERCWLLVIYWVQVPQGIMGNLQNRWVHVTLSVWGEGRSWGREGGLPIIHLSRWSPLFPSANFACGQPLARTLGLRPMFVQGSTALDAKRAAWYGVGWGGVRCCIVESYYIDNVVMNCFFPSDLQSPQSPQSPSLPSLSSITLGLLENAVWSFCVIFWGASGDVWVVKFF